MLDKVKEIIVEQLGVDADQIKPESNFVDDLGADSLDTVELIMSFEEEFGEMCIRDRYNGLQIALSNVK